MKLKVEYDGAENISQQIKEALTPLGLELCGESHTATGFTTLDFEEKEVDHDNVVPDKQE